jgi:hypothetical protein
MPLSGTSTLGRTFLLIEKMSLEIRNVRPKGWRRPEVPLIGRLEPTLFERFEDAKGQEWNDDDLRRHYWVGIEMLNVALPPGRTPRMVPTPVPGRTAPAFLKLLLRRPQRPDHALR